MSSLFSIVGIDVPGVCMQNNFFERLKKPGAIEASIRRMILHIMFLQLVFSFEGRDPSRAVFPRTLVRLV